VPLFGIVMIGSVVRSWVTSPVCHAESDDGGASGTLGRPEAAPLDDGWLDVAGGMSDGIGIGTETIFRVLNGSFIAWPGAP